MTATGAPAGIVLAAGAGTRFGGPKALATLDGEHLVTRALRVLRGGGCLPLVAVLGAAAPEVRAGVDLGAAEVVVNEHWREGMSTSLRAGLEAAGRLGAGGAVIALADQPLVTAEAVRRLVSAWRGGAVAAVATYGGRRRNPVLLDAAVWGEVLAVVGGDDGARVWLHAHPERVTEVACGDVSSAADVDVPADLDRLRGAGGRPGGPGPAVGGSGREC